MILGALGWLVLGLALAVLLIAALGVYRLPDVLARQHAATKAGTLSLALATLGTGLLAWDAAWTWRLVLLVLILLAVLPLASHALARAAMAGSETE
ncbi:MAG: monovalent cation/H(+) antiporter subunit G [Thiobacillus sp.]|nr:monovalent cation/H(+) antiporter subunit G [Thiobacillus sp.]